MATTVQHKRGTAAQVAAYVAVQGELVMDTTNSRLILGDGTLGGIALAKVSDVTASTAAANAAIAAIPAPNLHTNNMLLAQAQAIALSF